MIVPLFFLIMHQGQLQLPGLRFIVALHSRDSRPPFTRNPQSGGISLIEILVSICLVSIIMGLATVAYRPLWTKEELRSAADELIQQIQLARLKSILENRSYQLAADQRILTTFYYQNGQWYEGARFQLNETIDYQLSGRIHFSAKGFASPKTIYLNKHNYTKKVIVNLNGRIRSE